MRTLKLSGLLVLMLASLAACSSTFGAAPSGADGRYIGSSQQYQDYSQHTQQSPDVSATREHGW